MKISKKIYLLLWLCLVTAARSYGAAAEVVDESGNTALMIAIISDDMDKVEELLASRIDINAVNKKNGNTALLCAVDRGYENIMRLLVGRGADVNVVNKDGKTALMLCADKGCFDMGETLLKGGARVNLIDEHENKLLLVMVAILKNDVALAQALLARGVDMNIPVEGGGSVLMWAAASGHVDMVKLLLKNGVDINATSHEGYTALMWVINGDYQSLSMLRLLLERGIKIDVVSRQGDSALKFAVAANKLGAIRLLLEYGANVDLVSSDGYTALMLAVRGGNLGIIRVLLEYGASADLVNGQGDSALLLAAREGNRCITRLLSGPITRKVASRGVKTEKQLQAAKKAEQELLAEEEAESAAAEKKARKRLKKQAAKKMVEGVVQVVEKHADEPLEVKAPAREVDRECFVCFGCFVSADWVQFETCGHEMCRGCAQEVLEIACSAGATTGARCFSDECGRELFKEDDIEAICRNNVDLQGRYNQLLFELKMAELKSSGSSQLKINDFFQGEERVRGCPHCKVDFLIPARNGGGKRKKMRSCQCPHCNEFFCNSCYLPVHKGKSCAEVEAIAQAGPAPIVESDEVKACPTCNGLAMKEDKGCNFVVCERTEACRQVEFCWYCKKSFPKRKGHTRHMCLDGQEIGTSYGRTVQEARDHALAKQLRNLAP